MISLLTHYIPRNSRCRCCPRHTSIFLLGAGMPSKSFWRSSMGTLKHAPMPPWSCMKSYMPRWDEENEGEEPWETEKKRMPLKLSFEMVDKTRMGMGWLSKLEEYETQHFMGISFCFSWVPCSQECDLAGICFSMIWRRKKNLVMGYKGGSAMGSRQV